MNKSNERRPYTPFGLAVRRVLDEHRMLTSELAEELGLRLNQIYKIYSGDRPCYEYQEIIAAYLKQKFGADIPVTPRKPHWRKRNIS